MDVPHPVNGVRVVVLDERDDDHHHHHHCYHLSTGEDETRNDDTCDPFLRRHMCCPAMQSACAGSVPLAFLSHACFVIASLTYVRLSYVQLAWLRYALVYNDVPDEMINVDDDAALLV